MTQDDHIRNLLLTDSEKAIRILYELHFRNLVRISARLTQNPEVSKDIVQNIFVNVWEKRRSLGQANSKPIENYLMKAAINRSISFIRDSANRNDILKNNLVTPIDAQSTQNADSELMNTELRKSIQDGILSLPPQAKACFLLSRKFSMTYKEISLFLNISEKTVEGNISRALTYLRKHISILTF